MKRFIRMCKNREGQATTELAIMGTVIIMVLAYLLQQGYIYNARQALEMYTFRKALELSKAQERGITLTVIRDVITPSFFTGLNRQRLMATASVEYNPYKAYIPKEEDPQDVSTRQLIQIGEAMIRKGSFFEVPPTKIKVTTEDQEGDAEPMWTTSSISEIDAQTNPVRVTQRVSDYDYSTALSENTLAKTITKKLESRDKIPTAVTFEKAEKIIENYQKEDWAGKIVSVTVSPETIPKNVVLTLEEIVRREKRVQTYH